MERLVAQDEECTELDTEQEAERVNCISVLLQWKRMEKEKEGGKEDWIDVEHVSRSSLGL